MTISGPPSILRKYSSRRKDNYQGPNPWLPIHAPFHALHLHKEMDKRWILNLDKPGAAEVLNRHRPLVNLMSAVNGEPIEAPSLTQLLDKLVDEILRHPLRLDKLISGCKSRLRLSESSDCIVRPVGPCKVVNSLISSLRNELTCKVSLNDDFCYVGVSLPGPGSSSSENIKNQAIAIVGMAGVFPGAKDTEQLWSALEQGFDMHREV